MHVTFPIFKKQEELSRARLPLKECVAYVSAMLAEHPHMKETLAPLQVQLEAATKFTADIASYSLTASTQIEERRLEFLAADLIEKGQGFIWCSKCQRELKAGGTVFERYERGRGRLDVGGGRRFFCDSYLHLLFEVVDWRK